MGSLLEELARREAAVRQQIEEIREQIAGLESQLEAQEDRLSRLVITRETVEEILGAATRLVREPAGSAGVVDVVEAADTQPSVLGVVTVPPWRPGRGVSVLPRVYRDAVEIMVDAGGALRAGQIAVALGLPDEAKREGLRSKLKRLVDRGWSREDGPGLFAGDRTGGCRGGRAGRWGVARSHRLVTGW
ncbi:hypothetical protein [Sphaerisporangium perillae]|uniref:hypothetical protein n=1 Tax=Sphaerisporangium perillae TaxID=2935860 RepID=UPI00200D87DC|nr:hypothetical protein [Sphaerisporangium perillae]